MSTWLCVPVHISMSSFVSFPDIAQHSFFFAPLLLSSQRTGECKRGHHDLMLVKSALQLHLQTVKAEQHTLCFCSKRNSDVRLSTDYKSGQSYNCLLVQNGGLTNRWCLLIIKLWSTLGFRYAFTWIYLLLY